MVGDDLRNTVSCRGSSPSLRPSTSFGYSAVRGASVLDSHAGDAVVGSWWTVVDGLSSVLSDGIPTNSEGEHASDSALNAVAAGVSINGNVSNTAQSAQAAF
jgi:hypothetical protein